MEFKNIEAPECSGEFLSPFRCLRLSVADSNGLSPAWFFRVENGADQLIRDDIGGDIHNDNPCEEINQFTSAGKFYGYPYCFSEGILDNGFGKGKMTQWAWPATFPEASFTDEDCRNEELVKRPA
mmetsp:Transcript_13336/g.53249  ORF Transcript_13336/g.53249 Transcript_13336/m.53249 type:complete len:125 (-) Transcript_13336:371-745(-)